MKRINIDREKCIGCLTCASACMVSHKSMESRTRITIDNQGNYAPIFCRHCDQPECVYTCMTGAMKKNNETGYVDYDDKQCASCYMCIMACPYGVLKADTETGKKIMKCDMCKETKSSSPQCVQVCPMQAITLEEVE